MRDDEDDQPPEDVEQGAAAAAMTVGEQAADGFRRLKDWCLGKHFRDTEEALKPRKRVKLSNGDRRTDAQKETPREGIEAISTTPRPAKQPRTEEAESAWKYPEKATRDRELLKEKVKTLKAEKHFLEERKKQDAETSLLNNRIKALTTASQKAEKHFLEERKKKDAEASLLKNRIKALNLASQFDKRKLQTKSNDLAEALQNTKKLASDLRSSKAKVASYALQSTKADAVIDDLQRQVEQSKSTIGRLQLQVESSLEEKLKLSELMEQVKRRKSDLGASMEEIESYIEEKAKADSLVGFRRQTDQSKSKLTQHAKSEVDAKEKLSETIEQGKARESDLRLSKEKLESYALQKTKDDAVINALQRQVEQTKPMIAQLQQPVQLQLSELREQVEKLKSDLGASWEEVNYSAQEKDRADSVIKDLKCQAEKLKSESHRLQQQVKSQDEAGKKLSELTGDLEKLKTRLRSSWKEIESHVKEKANADLERDDLRRQVEQSKATIGQPQPQVESGGLPVPASASYPCCQPMATIGQPQPQVGPGGLPVPATNPFWQPKSIIGQQQPQVGPGGLLVPVMNPFWPPTATIGQPPPQVGSGGLPGMHPYKVPNWHAPHFHANSSVPFTPLPSPSALPLKSNSDKDQRKPSPSLLCTKETGK
jgi:chromosome segregation ATPase